MTKTTGKTVCVSCGKVVAYPEQDDPDEGVTRASVCEDCYLVKEEDELTYKG